MPNWACGIVSIVGTKHSVEKFAGRFLYEDVKRTADAGLRYFARSFTNTSWQKILDKITETFSGITEDLERMLVMPVDFTWSAHSCTINGDPQNRPDSCITLMDACIEDQVFVDIKTVESDMFFEEHITCDKQGNVSFACFDLPDYRRIACGCDGNPASLCDFNKCTSPECGKTDLEPFKSEVSVNG